MALDFNGVDQYVTQATLLDVVPANGTVMLRFVSHLVSAVEVKRLCFKVNDETGGLEDYFDMLWHASAAAGSRFLKLIKVLNGASITLVSTTEITQNTEYLVTVSWGATGFHLYLDTTQEDTNVDVNGWSNGVARDFIIAASNYGGPIAREWDGVISAMRVYNRQLSLAEIETIYYARGADNIVSGLLCRWLMNEEPDGTACAGANKAIDVSGNYHGTPANNPVYRAAPVRLVRPII